MGKNKIYCAKCQKKCSGEVLRVSDKYFHKSCFQCTTCQKSLAAGGFFSKDNLYYCVADYQKLYGTKCAACNQYVEGEVVATMGNTYHQKCFTCTRCKEPFQSGSKVTNINKEVLCEKCVTAKSPPQQKPPPQQQLQPQKAQPATQVPVSPTETLQKQYSVRGVSSSSPTKTTAATTTAHGIIEKTNRTDDYDPNDCAGCNEQLREGQALIALDRQWHVWCFKCKNCTAILNGEYLGKDGVPYCEKCYHKLFGVKCAHCNRFISGKVLQAGDNHHFHPTCARCTKCGDPFGDGEEMYLQGGAIWHPRCGPCPSEIDGVLTDTGTNGHFTDTEMDRMSNSAMSDLQYTYRSRTPSICGSVTNTSGLRQYTRTASPGLALREYSHRGYGYEDISRIYTYSYLTDQTQYLRKPIDPYDKPPVSPHFHRPHYHQSSSRSPSRPQSRNKSAMKVLVDSIASEAPRPKSPGMNNEEPIELSHYPAAKKPPPGEKSKIERDDFPAPPYPYTDPERRRRYSESYTGIQDSDDEAGGDQVDHAKVVEEKLKKEEAELMKMNSGLGSVILKDIKEQAKFNKWKQSNLDPRNASRTPSASKEPVYRLRYESPLGASPSRNLDHQKPFYDDEVFERSTAYRGSVGRSIGNAPSYNAIHSCRSPPRPGYGFRTSTLPTSLRNGYSSDFAFDSIGDKTHSTEFSCGKSDVSVDSITDGDRRVLMGGEMPISSTYSGALSYPQPGLHIRRSLPNMAHSILVHEPAKIYPYHLLIITNYRLPSDVDRCNLERHLSDVEFEAILQCTRSEFYRLPQWRRSEIKRRARLF